MTFVRARYYLRFPKNFFADTIRTYRNSIIDQYLIRDAAICDVDKSLVIRTNLLVRSQIFAQNPATQSSVNHTVLTIYMYQSREKIVADQPQLAVLMHRATPNSVRPSVETALLMQTLNTLSIDVYRKNTTIH